LPHKLSDNIFGAIKAALINFALGMIAAGLFLALTSALGAGIGWLIGGVGAGIGTKIGFEIGLFLLKWAGLGLLIAYGATELGKIGIAFGKYVSTVWEANGDRKKLEDSAEFCAEGMKDFLLGVLELIVMLVLAWGLGRTMGALGKTKFGQKLGYDKLTEWINKRTNKATEGTLRTIPQGITSEQFRNVSKLIRQNVGNISDDIVVQGSRAGGTAKATSDIDFAIRVSTEQFDTIIKQKFGNPSVGSAKERTMLNAIKTGKIQSGEAGLRGLRNQLQEILGMEVDISIIKSGGPFDNGPIINLPK
jgi:predicted nucleotidyltransferase